MTEQEAKRAKEIEQMLNYNLQRAQAMGEFPLPVTCGITQIFNCTQSERAEAWKRKNDLAYGRVPDTVP